MGVRRQYDKFVSNFLSSNDERPEEAIEGSQIDWACHDHDIDYLLLV